MTEADVNKPNWLQANMSVGNIISIAVTLIAVGGFYQQTTFQLAQNEEFRKVRTAQTDRKFEELNLKIAEMPQISYRVTKVEGALEQINIRIENGFSNFSARLDRNAEAMAQDRQAIMSAIAQLDTRVAVLTQRLEAEPDKRRAELRDRLDAIR